MTACGTTSDNKWEQVSEWVQRFSTASPTRTTKEYNQWQQMRESKIEWF